MEMNWDEYYEIWKFIVMQVAILYIILRACVEEK